MQSEKSSELLWNKVRWGLALWREEAAALLVIVVLSVLKAAVVSTYPFIFKAVINRLASVSGTGELGWLTAALAGAGAAHFAINAFLQILRSRANIRMERRLRRRLFSRLLAAGDDFHSRHSIGDFVTRLTDDLGTGKLTWFLGSGIFRALEGLLVLSAAIVSMAYLNASLALICIAPLPLMLWQYARVSVVLRQKHRTLQGAISSLNSELDATFSGIRVVKANGLESVRTAQFARAVQGQCAGEVDTVRTQSLIEGLYGYAWQFCTVLNLFVGGSWIMKGWITLGDFVAFNAFVLYLTFPVFDLGNFISRWRQAVVLIERLQELDTAPAAAAGERSAESPAMDEIESLEVSGLRFTHPGAGAEMLKGLTFTVRCGELIAVAGAVGAGKSTLIRLLAGVLDPGGGEIRFRGAPLERIGRDAWCNLAGYVPQDPVTFSGTLQSNLRLGRERLSAADIEAASMLAALHGETESMPQGYSTQTGQKGCLLSGGQKQRLALARAYAGSPRVLLLDDPTSSLDVETEALVLRGLRGILDGRFCLVATHRRAILESADRIIVLDGGEIVEEGTHRELLSLRRAYYRLYRQELLREADLL